MYHLFDPRERLLNRVARRENTTKLRTTAALWTTGRITGQSRTFFSHPSLLTEASSPTPVIRLYRRLFLLAVGPPIRSSYPLSQSRYREIRAFHNKILGHQRLGNPVRDTQVVHQDFWKRIRDRPVVNGFSCVLEHLDQLANDLMYGKEAAVWQGTVLALPADFSRSGVAINVASSTESSCSPLRRLPIPRWLPGRPRPLLSPHPRRLKSFR
ncbi:hypothetical protein PC118_g4950 [Phytophthora cactorum]|uniref:Uncharacterized protein n=1 Tax=Phytophthora cactorum TaxID=29920 RepID=A0A8T0Z6F4_9STRA|nr:hypothetical protein PC111_g15845 [Phytophthora cactorum]KAG2810097.1 hypothetical protein PC112_g16208 [Phytophthora cactorum]KAG2857962.1 hypothetical protein PC113_g10228 [Phytophthora cactorum]KAG2912884.1 hypothetical protein PC114_g8762 [Phytophthora cactorum]KAG2941085.1 hypothetical protein PC117_g10331 [Phytophthora cactorum]